jgi:manganese-dependent inorganic pyrophosphatase
MGGAKVEIAQVTAIDVDDVLSRQDELEAALRDIVAAKGLDLFLFVVTDILNNDSVAVAVGPRAATVETAYDVTLENNRARLKGVVSRKLQIVPVLTETFSRG